MMRLTLHVDAARARSDSGIKKLFTLAAAPV
jgi:hypothetical protein